MTADEMIRQAEARHAHHVGVPAPATRNPRAIVYACRECWAAVLEEAVAIAGPVALSVPPNALVIFKSARALSEAARIRLRDHIAPVISALEPTAKIIVLDGEITLQAVMQRTPE